MKVIDVKTAPNLKVGYVDGRRRSGAAGDRAARREAHVHRQDELAWGDLSKYDVIVTGVRAYERRDDLRAYNRRLIDYVERGGTVIVQYNKFEFNQAQYGPYPGQRQRQSRDRRDGAGEAAGADASGRSPSRTRSVRRPGTNWVQERGLYFLGEKDPKYVDLVSMVDSFPDNPGREARLARRGAVGKGRWVYLGLGLWRQLPAGTDGAYQLLANLISLSKGE